MSTAERLVRFNGVGALGIAVQLGTVHALTAWLGVSPVPATATGVAAAILHNFIWHRLWTWADRRATAGPVLTTFSRFALANGVVSLIGNVAIVATLTATTQVDGLSANVIAMVACGLVNYWLGDRVVFKTADVPHQNSGWREVRAG